MITISQDQALARWDTLPDKLKEMLYSEVNANFLWKISEAEHLPEEKIRGVSRAAGYVLMGFMHPGDLAHELQEENIAPKPVAESIAKAINDRIFEPLREEIDRIYEPPSKIALPGESPKIIEEVKPPVPVAAAPKPPEAGPAPIDISKIFTAKPFDAAQGRPPVPSGEIKPLDIARGKPFDAAPLDMARDRQGKPLAVSPSPTQPPTQPLSYRIAPPAPTTPPRVSQPTIAPPAATGKPMSEFERLKLSPERAKRVEGLPSTDSGDKPARPPAVSGVEPAMLYKESEAKVGEKAAGFKLEIPVSQFRERKPFGAAQGKPALFEFGLDRQPQPKPIPPTPPAPPASRIVNYSDLRTPLPKIEEGENPPSPGSRLRQGFGGQVRRAGRKEEGRDIQEITAEEKQKTSEASPSVKPFSAEGGSASGGDSAQGITEEKKPTVPAPAPKPPTPAPAEKKSEGSIGEFERLGLKKSPDFQPPPLVKREGSSEPPAPRPRIEPPQIRKPENPPNQ